MEKFTATPTIQALRFRSQYREDLFENARAGWIGLTVFRLNPDRAKLPKRSTAGEAVGLTIAGLCGRLFSLSSGAEWDCGTHQKVGVVPYIVI